MKRAGKFLFAVVAMLFVLPAFGGDVCAICGKPLSGAVYLITDQITGQQKMVCSNCILLPRCFICGLPVKDGGTQLSDGRWLCARDAQTAVMDTDTARQVADEVRDELDRLFYRDTSFPTNVNVAVIDRVDVDAMFKPVGNEFESPNLLGCIKAVTGDGPRHYAMSLLTGLPLVELKATAAHEFSHAWVGENVSPGRHAHIARDAEEGFCEMVAYLLMDSEGEEAQKQFILRNHYTRGQVNLFIAAEQEYGFDEILDWMKYGQTSELEDGHLEEIRDVKMPVGARVSTSVLYATTAPIKTATSIELQGILWGNPPVAIINNKSVFPNDEFKVNIAGQEVALRCLKINTNSVRIEYEGSGRQVEVPLWKQ
ncbi:MAG: protein DA1 [Limisphaerales bacterium]